MLAVYNLKTRVRPPFLDRLLSFPAPKDAISSSAIWVAAISRKKGATSSSIEYLHDPP